MKQHDEAAHMKQLSLPPLHASYKKHRPNFHSRIEDTNRCRLHRWRPIDVGTAES